MIKSIIYLKQYISKTIFTFFIKKKAASVGEGLIVNHYSSVTLNTHLGNNVNLNGLRVIGGGNVHIGNNFHSATGCLIMTTIHNYDNGAKIPYDETVIHKDVIIEDNVWLGLNVVILPGVTVSEGAIVQAGSIVSSNVPPCAIVGGNPARVFSLRDKDHYYNLKEKKQFH